MSESWREGSVTVTIDHAGLVRVIVDRHPSIGGSLCVIETFHGGNTAHTVTPFGIDSAIRRAEAARDT